MKLNVHLECFAMRKDLSTEKTKCQVFFLPEMLVKNAGINNITPLKLIHYLLENTLTDFFANFAYKLSRQSGQLFPHVCG